MPKAIQISVNGHVAEFATARGALNFVAKWGNVATFEGVSSNWTREGLLALKSGQQWSRMHAGTAPPLAPTEVPMQVDLASVGGEKPARGTTSDVVARTINENPNLGATEIAALVGVTRQRVHQIANDLGVQFLARRGGKFTPNKPRRARPFGETRMRVAKLHQEQPDLGITEIATICGVTRQRIDQIADELGITFKARHGRNELDVTPPSVPTAQAVRKWRQDHGDITQGTLSALLGVSKDTVARWERGMRPSPAMLTVAFEALERRPRLESRDDIQ